MVNSRVLWYFNISMQYNMLLYTIQWVSFVYLMHVVFEWASLCQWVLDHHHVLIRHKCHIIDRVDVRVVHKVKKVIDRTPPGLRERTWNAFGSPGDGHYNYLGSASVGGLFHAIPVLVLPGSWKKIKTFFLNVNGLEFEEILLVLFQTLIKNGKKWYFYSGMLEKVKFTN